MTQVMAHRGASAQRPENTLAAFELAIEMGADWIELDVRRTADDVLVISHDAHIADGRALVDYTFDELPHGTLTLAEALDAAAAAKLNIEIKNDPDDPDYDTEHQISDAVVGLALAYRDPADLLITSFNIDTVRRIKAVNSDMPAGLITAVQMMNPQMQVERLVEAGLDAIHPWDLIVDASLVDMAHAAGLDVNVWTVNDPDRMRELISMGVDGLISDAPDIARRIVDEG